MFHPKLSRLANILLLKTTNSRSVPQIRQPNFPIYVTHLTEIGKRLQKKRFNLYTQTVESNLHQSICCVFVICASTIGRGVTCLSQWSLVSEEEYKSTRYEPCFVLFSDHHLYIEILLTMLIHYIPNVDNILRSGTLIKQKTTVSYLHHVIARRKKT